MKKVVVISDSFKGTLSSREICDIARESVPRILPGCAVTAIPVADGGEGTVSCFLDSIGASPVTVSVQGPYGETVDAVYARKGNRAIIEMASAAGLPMVGSNLDPERTTTNGVGMLLRHAVENGCNELLLGLGGSCTNDGGCGCAAALGTRFFDADGNPFVPVGGTLGNIARIDNRETEKLLRGVSLTLMSDVDNPLCGVRGAAHVFGPQKGADAAMVERLDAGLAHLASVIERDLGVRVADIPGAGAAGGMGAGCMAFLGARMRSGIEAVLDLVDFDAQIDSADLVITGEGRIDSQSVHGKVISGIAKRTQPRGVPLVAIVGSIAPDAQEAYELGVTAMFGIDRTAKAFTEYAAESAAYYRATLEDVLRLLAAFA
ncbi:MAG: glycerate kinase [Oscillospiraceae bacterium]|nr:glycerate kinase [Oscillospiraceae bacterium]MBQ2177970.1 glycerate kinase [Oscillospiraceae bacterium]